MAQRPVSIGFTGIDRIETIGALQSLSARYPIEWGMLVDEARAGQPRFPDAKTRRAFAVAGGLRLVAHVCGAAVGQIATAPERVELDLTGFQRIQINHGLEGSLPAQIENSWRFGCRLGVRVIVQCQGEFPGEERLDWLFDTSFGSGRAPKAWPRLPVAGPFCGYSGGIGPGNAAEVVRAIDAPPGGLYWIDMGSGVRTQGALDLDKCEAVCKAVYGLSDRPEQPKG